MQDPNRPREVIIHQSANRPNQLVGGDRELVLVTILITASLAFSIASVSGLVLAAMWHVSAMAALKRMGKADPMLRDVYLRHIRYRSFYPARSGLYSQCLQPPKKWL